jgi:hypothetical protein
MGTEYYLADLTPAEKEDVLEALCLLMTGSETQLALQKSMASRSILETLIENRLHACKADFRVGEFEQININDEYIWEAHSIPAPSLSRFPYPEYHSSRDEPSIIREESLKEVLEVCKGAIADLEKARIVTKKFHGTMCLSNPYYDLYVDPGQVSFGEEPDARQRNLRRLMDRLPTLRGPVTNVQLAQELDLALDAVDAYLDKWAEKQLLEIV